MQRELDVRDADGARLSGGPNGRLRPPTDLGRIIDRWWAKHANLQRHRHDKPQAVLQTLQSFAANDAPVAATIFDRYGKQPALIADTLTHTKAAHHSPWPGDLIVTNDGRRA
jgi:hypothetical protein